MSEVKPDESTISLQKDEPANARVPMFQKLSWGVGSVGDQFITNGINSLALPIYTISLGVSPVLIGYALAIPRAFDAITDPIMGNLSDNTRSRWGRRRPYIFLGGILCGLLFALLWTPPTEAGGTVIFTYFLVLSILYYAAYTIFAMSRQALGFEMSTDYDERTTLFTINALFAGVAGFGIPWLYKLAFHPFFAGPEKDEIIGVRWVGLAVGLLIMATALPGALFTRERAVGQAQPRINLFRASALTLKNRPFLIVTGIVVMVYLAVFLAGPINVFINIYYVCGGNEELGATWGGVAGTTQAIMTLAGASFVAVISRHIGKRRTIMLGLSLAIIGYLATWWLFTPEYPWLQVVFMILLQPGLMTVWVLSGSILADICDFDELKTGLRREGMFGAAYTFITKIASACITSIAGYMLVWAGYQERAPVTAETLTNLRILFIVIPVIFLSIGFVLAYIFPITEEAARDIRRQLDARHAEEAAG